MSNPEYRVLVFMADGEITGVYLVPEDQMSEDGMDKIHRLARNQEIKILNMVPSVVLDLHEVYDEGAAWGRDGDPEDE